MNLRLARFGGVLSTLLLVSSIGMPAAFAQLPPVTSTVSATATVAGGGPEPKTTLRLYLHAKEPCGSGFFLDRNDSQGDAEGCGTLQLQADGLVRTTYDGTQALNHTVRPAFPGMFYLYVRTDHQDRVAVGGDLLLGSARCFWGDPGEEHRRLVGNEWVLFELPCTFSGASSADAKPRLVVSARRHLVHHLGHEGDHASYVEFGADPVEANPTRGPRRDGSEPPGTASPGGPDAAAELSPVRGASGTGGILLLASAAVAVTVLRRRD